MNRSPIPQDLPLSLRALGKPKLTPWFSPYDKPVRVGVYETDSYGGPRLYQHWNGEFWGAVGFTVDDAQRRADGCSMYQDEKWRGLAKEPKP